MAQSAFYTDGDENSSGKHTDEDQSGDVVNQVHDLAVKMKENEKRLDALEKAVDQTSTQTDTPSDKEGSAQEVPAQEVPVQATVPAQVEAPVQQPPAKPAAPVHVLPPKENQFKLTTDFSHTTYKEPGVSMQEKGLFMEFMVPTIFGHRMYYGRSMFFILIVILTLAPSNTLHRMVWLKISGIIW